MKRTEIAHMDRHPCHVYGKTFSRVNLKAELEIRQLHEKLDHQLVQQWKKLAELQQIQIELLGDERD